MLEIKHYALAGQRTFIPIYFLVFPLRYNAGMSCAPNRRWFRFSLRTVFVVVTIVGCIGAWATYHLNWQRQRRHAIENGEVGVIVSASAFVAHPPPRQPPLSLRLFGAESIYGFGLVSAADASDAELERLRALFPETTVVRP